MKKYIILIIIPFLFIACEDYLDFRPEQILSEDEVYNDYYSMRLYLDNCYGALQDYLYYTDQDRGLEWIGRMTDEGTQSTGSTGEIGSIINTGAWLNQPKAFEVGWENDGTEAQQQSKILTLRSKVYINAWYTIRICNNLIDRVPSSSLTQTEKNELLGQAYFFRGWYYFQLIIRWGGMFIPDKPYTPNDDLDMPRLTYQESHDWLIEENIDKAIELLPQKWSALDKGRVNKMAAMTFKSMAELYAASPLMQNDLNSTQVRDYNTERCINAAKYANEAIQNLSHPDCENRLLDGADYNLIFYQADKFVSDEAIFYKNRGFGGSVHWGYSAYVQRILFLPRTYHGGKSGTWVQAQSGTTYNMMRKFEVINGGVAYPQEHASSGYDSQDPAANRDPRFYHNIIMPGEPWGRELNGDQKYMETWDSDVHDTLKGVELDPNFANFIIPSGLVTKKYLWEGADYLQALWDNYTLNLIYMRVAQLYLDYAEAMNEAYGPTADPEGYGMTALDAINVIRNRVGMVDVNPEFTATKAAFRDRIRNERAVELLNENHRWWDIRRWMIAHEVLKEPIQGLKTNLVTQGATPPEHTFSYSVVDIAHEIRVFDMKHYWYPIPQALMDQYFNIQQNPGW